jgi:hypothetical protein
LSYLVVSAVPLCNFFCRIQAQKAARAKQLRAKFERWEANEIKKEQNSGTVNIIEELGEEQSQIESTKS